MDSKVFDVSKPGKITAEPTSRPLIVDSKPTAPDPMVKDDNFSALPDSGATSATPIRVSMADEEHPVSVTAQAASPISVSVDSGTTRPDSSFQAKEAPAVSSSPFNLQTSGTIPPNEMEDEPKPDGDQSGAGGNFTPLTSLIPSEGAESKTNTNAHHIDNLPENHSDDPGWQDAPPLPISKGAGPKKRGVRIFVWIMLLILLVAVAGYLAIDAGLVKSDVKLPFHIFNKQKTSVKVITPAPAPVSTPVSPPPAAKSDVPEGFTKYTVEGASASFAYPTTWGAPTLTKDPGFSKRGGTNKTDGTHAYLVSFATNKDIQVALTSSKYLPDTRSSNAAAWYYYDYLQWCIGTNDAKFYQQTLHFSTENKVDTPGTVSCDEGPLKDAVKLNNETIFQAKTNINTSPQLQSFASVDLYTKNLTNKDIPVLRVKDVAMKSSEDIKKLLETVKVESSSSSSSSTSTTQ